MIVRGKAEAPCQGKVPEEGKYHESPKTLGKQKRIFTVQGVGECPVPGGLPVKGSAVNGIRGPGTVGFSKGLANTRGITQLEDIRLFGDKVYPSAVKATFRYA
jgi:hypothetical protein